MLSLKETRPGVFTVRGPAPVLYFGVSRHFTITQIADVAAMTGLTAEETGTLIDILIADDQRQRAKDHGVTIINAINHEEA